MVVAGSILAIADKRVGLAGEEERKRGFGPDQMGDVAEARARPGDTLGQLHIVPHHLVLRAVVEFHVLLQIGLHDAQAHAGH